LLRTELIDTIRAVQRGSKAINSVVANGIAQHAADDTLSEREIEVLESLARGNSNKRIGIQLSISEETVKGHVKSILSKLGANDRTHAVMLGLTRGILQL
jgi:two-component system, NarL family, response regulator